jgi:hypothetical protein
MPGPLTVLRQDQNAIIKAASRFPRRFGLAVTVPTEPGAFHVEELSSLALRSLHTDTSTSISTHLNPPKHRKLGLSTYTEMDRTDDVDPGQPQHLLSNRRERDDDGGRDGSSGALGRGRFVCFRTETINLI